MQMILENKQEVIIIGSINKRNVSKTDFWLKPEKVCDYNKFIAER